MRNAVTCILAAVVAQGVLSARLAAGVVLNGRPYRPRLQLRARESFPAAAAQRAEDSTAAPVLGGAGAEGSTAAPLPGGDRQHEALEMVAVLLAEGTADSAADVRALGALAHAGKNEAVQAFARAAPGALRRMARPAAELQLLAAGYTRRQLQELGY